MRTMNNYYETLNLNESASAEEIKRAYRKMAMDAHPDRGGDPEQFKNINAAYETLSDPNKRQEYDGQRRNPFANFGGFNQAGPQHQHFNFSFGPGGVNIDELFSQFHGGGFRRQPKNRDIQITLTVDFASTLADQVKVVNVQSPGRTETHRITIPRGIENGGTIKFANQGDYSDPSIPRGDLYVIVQFEHHPDFQLMPNYSLMTGIKISAFDAILGTKKIIRSVSGTSVELVVPPATAPGTVFKIRGHGLYIPGTSARADLMVQTEVVIPKITDAVVLAKLKEIANAAH